MPIHRKEGTLILRIDSWTIHRYANNRFGSYWSHSRLLLSEHFDIIPNEVELISSLTHRFEDGNHLCLFFANASAHLVKSTQNKYVNASMSGKGQCQYIYSYLMKPFLHGNRIERQLNRSTRSFSRGTINARSAEPSHKVSFCATSTVIEVARKSFWEISTKNTRMSFL